MTLRKTSRSLPIALLRARESVMRRFRPVLAAHRVTEQQWRILRVLAEAGPLDATQLSAQCCILRPSLTRILRTLESRRLILRQRHGDDGRRLALAATPKARNLIAEVAPQSRAVYGDLGRRFGPKRLEQLLDLLADLAAV